MDGSLMPGARKGAASSDSARVAVHEFCSRASSIGCLQAGLSDCPVVCRPGGRDWAREGCNEGFLMQGDIASRFVRNPTYSALPFMYIFLPARARAHRPSLLLRFTWKWR
jgi:hypothetical protein